MNFTTTTAVVVVKNKPNFLCLAKKSKSLFPIDNIKGEEEAESLMLIFYLIALIYILILADHVCNAYFMPSIEYLSFEKLKLSPHVAGSTILAAASSSTELFISLMGVFFARSDISLNSIIGAASYNLLVITSICCFCVYKFPTQLLKFQIIRDFLFYSLNLVLLILFLLKNDMKGFYWYESLSCLALYILFILFNIYDTNIQEFVNRFDKTIRKCCSIQKRKKNLKVTFQDEISMVDVENEPIKNNEMFRVINRNKVIDLNIDHFSNDYNEPYDVFQPYKELKPLNFSTKFKLIFVLPARLFAYFTIVDFRRFETRKDQFLFVTILTSLFQIGLCSYFLLFVLVKCCETFGLSENVIGFSFLSIASSVDETLAALSICKREVKRIKVKRHSLNRLNSVLSNSIANNLFGITVGIGLPYFLNSLIINSKKNFFSPIYTPNLTLSLFESSDQDTDEESDSDNRNKENVKYNATARRSGELAQLLGQLFVSEDRIRSECKRRVVHVSMIKNKNALHCTILIIL
ncbi:unnamed protein product [Brachionus calyciflorus]|uniref:Sodium/calcium exchanger membrane region domain-containing protein n=1 Tax=Brachionus calyciflorus TaxID=104777 RepID=A0A813Z597_9BILA|nr:unnamed protein product [Brachionus calyciflorus]